ncbi:MAG: ribosomal protein S18-alanine N-acetyltransferase [Desulfomonilaceae bacterium]
MATNVKGVIAREMTAPDLDQVLFIEQSSYGAPWSRDMFMDEISNPLSRALVFELDGRIVGYLCCWEIVDECHILNIAVHPDYRRQGVGSAILKILEAACRAKGLTRILLDVGRRNNPARNLYKKMGFKAVGFRKNYYKEVGDDALLMDKILT